MQHTYELDKHGESRFVELLHGGVAQLPLLWHQRCVQELCPPRPHRQDVEHGLQREHFKQRRPGVFLVLDHLDAEFHCIAGILCNQEEEAM